MTRLILKRLTIILPLLLIGSFLFFWYQIRPAQIKHDCSWVQKHSDAIPYRPAMTQAELEAKGIIRTCKNEFDLVRKMVPTYDISSNDNVIFNNNYTLEQKRIIWNATSCREDGDRVIADYKNPIQAVSAKDWYVKATSQEYQFCLHDKGL